MPTRTVSRGAAFRAIVSICPDPRARAPRYVVNGDRVHDRLHLAPPALQGAVSALFTRDTRNSQLDSAQRLSHFPATPLVKLSWFQRGDAGHIERSDEGPQWQPYGARDRRRQPVCADRRLGCATNGLRSGTLCLTADVASSLMGLDVAAINDRIVPAREVLAPSWQPLLDSLLDAADDTATLAALERHLAPSGRSLRQWESLVRTEGVFFAAREQYQTGRSLDWAAVAQDEGFADQSHLSRAVKRTTGFAPTEFAQRYVEDESFWVYRLWV